MTDPTDRLERLAKLHAEGALSDTEYQAAKARALAEPQTPVDNGLQQRQPISAAVDEVSLSAIWRERFALIDQHGMPNSRDFSVATRSMPFWHRSRMVFSLPAFFFGPLYYVYLGLWRSALSLVGATFAFSIVWDWLQLPPSIDRMAWVVPAAVFAWAVIPLYYFRVRRGINDWNPVFWLKAEPAPRVDPMTDQSDRDASSVS